MGSREAIRHRGMGVLATATQEVLNRVDKIPPFHIEVGLITPNHAIGN